MTLAPAHKHSNWEKFLCNLLEGLEWCSAPSSQPVTPLAILSSHSLPGTPSITLEPSCTPTSPPWGLGLQAESLWWTSEQTEHICVLPELPLKTGGLELLQHSGQRVGLRSVKHRFSFSSTVLSVSSLSFASSLGTHLCCHAGGLKLQRSWNRSLGDLGAMRSVPTSTGVARHSGCSCCWIAAVQIASKPCKVRVHVFLCTGDWGNPKGCLASSVNGMTYPEVNNEYPKNPI